MEKNSIDFSNSQFFALYEKEFSLRHFIKSLNGATIGSTAFYGPNIAAIKICQELSGIFLFFNTWGKIFQIT